LYTAQESNSHYAPQPYTKVLRLRRYERISTANRRFSSNARSLWPKISGRRGCPTNHSFSQKTMLHDLSYGIKIWTDFSSVLSILARLTTDWQTNGRMDGHSHR